tara:strand:+ start:180 stop:554 length:375 start_codon:yes stop_codon:yes gene_type:complete
MCVGGLFSRPKTPDAPPIPVAPTPPPPPQEVQQAPAPEPEAPAVADVDLASEKDKTNVKAAGTSKVGKEKKVQGTSAYISQANEGTGLQTIAGTQQGLNIGTTGTTTTTSASKPLPNKKGGGKK